MFKMSKEINEINNILSKAGGKWSIYSKNLATNNVIYDLNSNEPFPSASIGMTTANKISSLLEGLYKATYFSKELSNQFINIMKKSGNENRIKRYLPNLEVASKSGSIPGVRSDVGIIFEKVPYTLCVLSKDLPDESNKPENKGVLAIVAISKLIYETPIKQI